MTATQRPLDRAIGGEAISDGGAMSLRRKAISGLLWMLTQSVVSKFASIVGQILLAYLLLPEHFATISLTYTVATFARVLQNGGLREVLVCEERRCAELSNAAFWLALLLGFLSAAVMLIGRPIAETIYQSKEVWGLLTWLAAQPIIESLAIVPTARLQIRHRFRLLAGLTVLRGCTQTAATVLFAWLDWGGLSFVFGAIAASSVYTLGVWVADCPKLLLTPEFPKWRDLWSGTLSLSLVGVATVIVQQVDYVMLGIFQAKVDVGQYFFAYGVASQATHLLMQNIATVFLPLLCKLQLDPKRQLAASLSAFRILAAVGLPLSFLQYGLIDASFRLFLPEKWLPAVPLAEALSLGLGFNVLSSLCWSLLKSQGRFNVILHLNWLGAIPFTAAIAVGSAYGTTQTVAWVVATYCLIYSPLVLWLSIKGIGGTIQDVSSIFCVPLVLSAIALFVASKLEMMIPSFDLQLLARMAVVVIAFVTLYSIGLVLNRHPVLKECSRLFLERAK